MTDNRANEQIAADAITAYWQDEERSGPNRGPVAHDAECGKAAVADLAAAGRLVAAQSSVPREPTEAQVERAYRAFCEARLGRAITDEAHESTRSRLELTWIGPTIAAAAVPAGGEPTEAQVEAAAKAMWDLRKLSGDPEWDVLEYGVKNEYRKDASAALEAAARAAQEAAPQAGHNDLIAKTFSEIHGDLRSFSHAEVKQIVYPLIDALRATALPSSGVDEDALAEVIRQQFEVGNIYLDSFECKIAARAVAEWLKGQER